jgi:putative endonuclease
MQIVTFFFNFKPNTQMITVYVLKNFVNDEHYTGMTSDMSRRLKEHNSGKNRYTKAFMPWYTVYSEVHTDFATARVHEKYLKSSSGKHWLKKQIN